MFNRRSCELFNFRNEAEALGKTNYDLFPKHLTDHYTAGDRQIMESKKAVLNELEVSPVETNRTISDIALEVGFTDHSHFIRSFKQFRGITPTQYRKRHHEQPG